MKKITILISVFLCAVLVGSAWGHYPEGQVLTAFQWPAGLEPTMDGDLSEWDIVPEDYSVPFADYHRGSDGEPPTDFSDLNFNTIVGYSTGTNRVYFMMERFDNLWDRDGQGGVAGGDDTWEIHIDGDHSGDQMRWNATEIEDETERELAQGRFSQAYHTRFPQLGDTGGQRKLLLLTLTGRGVTERLRSRGANNAGRVRGS